MKRHKVLHMLTEQLSYQILMLLNIDDSTFLRIQAFFFSFKYILIEQSEFILIFFDLVKYNYLLCKIFSILSMFFERFFLYWLIITDYFSTSILAQFLQNSLLQYSSWSEEGNGNPLQHSCLENPVDSGAWWADVHGVTQSLTQLKKLNMNAQQSVNFDF